MAAASPRSHLLLCTGASLAEQHFNWSQFCQTRQAKTHLRIQGVPADTHTLHRTHTITRKSPNFSAVSVLVAKWTVLVTAWLKGSMRGDECFLNRYSDMSPSCCPAQHDIHFSYPLGLLEEDVTLLSFCWAFPWL